ncbi:MAG: MFS transporter [Acidimicrobiia bacterium]|nr:MFS transporter [Acidimicrobiia bacterium]
MQPPLTSRDERGPTGFSRRLTLAAVCAATAMLMLDIAVVNTALAHIGRSLNAGLSGMQWVVDAYTLALAAAVLSAGSLNDRFGRKRSLVVGLTLFTVASVGCAVAGNIVFLDAARAVQGVGGAVMFAASLAILADAFPEAGERAKAFAAYGATIGASFALGPLVGGALTSGFGWRAIFYVNIPLGLACIAMTVAGVRESRDPHRRPLDWPGQILLTGGLFLLVLGLLRGNTDGWTSAPILAELIGAGVLLVAFLVTQHLVRHPMLPLRLFRNPSFTGAQVAAFAISGSFFAVFLYTTLYLQVVKGLSPIEAGLVYVPPSILLFVISGASAQLLRRVSLRTMIVVGLAFVSAGLVTCTLADTDSSWAVMLPGITLASIGTGLFNPALSAVALGHVEPHQSGLAAGVNDAFRNIGVAVGVAALGALIPGHAVLGGAPREFVDGLHHALLVGAVLAAVGAVASAVLIAPRMPAAEPVPGLEPVGGTPILAEAGA